MDEIKFDDWKKLDIRVGKVLEVKDHPEAEKLYVLKVDFGEFERWIVSGLREHYTKEELEGKRFAFIVNLEPKTLIGVKSEGMILAAVEKDKVVLLEPDKDISEGSKIE